MKHWNTAFLERLLQVQDTDLEIRGLNSQIEIYYQRSKEEDPELTRLKMEISRVDEGIETVESQNQMYSTTLEDIRTAIKGLLTTKSGVPKPRTRSSTEALKIEEEKLGSLVEETSEQLSQFYAERETLVSKAESRAKTLEKEQEGPEAEIRKLQQQIKKLEKQRVDEVDGLPSMLLKHYDRLRSSRSGIGLTILRDGVCTVCRMQMPTAIISRLNKGERIPVCPACGRMVARIEQSLLPTKDDASDTSAETAGEEKKPSRKASKKGEADGADESTVADVVKKPTRKRTAKKSAAKKSAKKTETKKTATTKASKTEKTTKVAKKTTKKAAAKSSDATKSKKSTAKASAAAKKKSS